VNFLYASKMEDGNKLPFLAETQRHCSAAIAFGVLANNSQTWSPPPPIPPCRPWFSLSMQNISHLSFWVEIFNLNGGFWNRG